MTKKTNPMQPEKKKETLGEMVGSFVFMVLLALVFRSLAYEPFHIPSGSMLSTLYKGDYIFVSKFSYGYSRYSFPFSPKLFDNRLFETLPKRGDVVVFRNPADTKTDYIKRIVGLPGETIQMKHGRLYVNGNLVEKTRSGEVLVEDDRGQPHLVMSYRETLPEGRSHTVLDDRSDMRDAVTGFDPDNTAEYIVPEGHYFMMGDNRDHSQDSRFSKALGYGGAPGYVPFDHFVGRAEIIAFSWSGLSGRWFKAIQ